MDISIDSIHDDDDKTFFFLIHNFLTCPKIFYIKIILFNSA